MNVFLNEIGHALIPLGICVALPVLIVWLVTRNKTNADNRRAEVLIKAIENNCDTNMEALSESMAAPKKSPRELLNSRLLRGVLFSLLGVAFGIFSYVSTTVPDTDFDDWGVFMVMSGIAFAIGIAYLVVYLITRKQAN